MKLQKIVLGTSVLAVLFCGSVHAADPLIGGGEVSFIGSVTAKTCEFDTVIDGAVTNTLHLGSVNTLGTGDKSEIFIKIKNPQSCDFSQMQHSTVRWGSPLLNDVGIKNARGTAKDASVELTAVNSKMPNISVNRSNPEIEFTPATVKNDGGFKFSAQLKAGNEKGSLDTSAAYVVTYE